MGLRESNRVYLIPQTLFHHPKPKINEKMGDLPKLAWSRDVTGKVDIIHSNLTRKNAGKISHFFELIGSSALSLSFRLLLVTVMSVITEKDIYNVTKEVCA